MPVAWAEATRQLTLLSSEIWKRLTFEEEQRTQRGDVPALLRGKLGEPRAGGDGLPLAVGTLEGDVDRKGVV